LLLAGTGLAGLVAAGPWLASRTPLPEYAARQALADFRGSVHVGGTSLNWFTPQEITGLEVRDAAGRPLLIAPRVTLSRSLAGLLLDRSDLGTVRVEGAELHVEAEGATTNLEAALAAYLRPSTGESRPGPAGAPLPAVRVECIGAKLTVADGGKEWAVGPADVTAVLPRDPAERVSVTVKSATPRLDLDACLARDGSAGTVKLSAEGLPLAPGGVFLRRFDPAAGLDGSLTATLDGEWTGADWRAEGKVAVAGLDVAGPWLADPRLRLGSVEVPVKAACKSGRLTVERAEVVTDLGRASLSGSAEPAAGLAGLARAELRLSASADLARVAAILPKTLRLRDGLTVTGGTVQLDARAEGPALTASLHTASLAAVLDGQPIEWPQPLVAELTAHRAGEGLPVVDRLRCESEGVKLEAAGTAERLTATAEADLGRLRTHLARFADLGAIRFAGTATARVTAGRGPGDALTASGTVAARGLRLSGPTGKEWVEDACSARFELTGKLPDAGPLTVASASMAFTAAGDEASAELLAPLTVPGPMSASARVRLTGELARWRARVAPWADLTGLEPAGVADLSACISAGADAFTADEARASVRGFRFRGYGLTLDEPTLTASAATARYELATGEVSLTRPALICPTATATFAALRMTPRGQFIGTGDVSADLARVQRLAMTPTPKGPDALGGKAAGRVELAAGGDGQGVSADLACTDVTVGDPAAPLWKDPTSRALVRGVFAPDWDALRLDEFRLETPALGAVGKGAVGKLCTRQELALTGDFRYDLAKLGPQLRPYLGSMEVTGSGTRPFRIGGTTTAPAAELGAGWESVKGYGCVVGPATVDARLAGDWLRVTPFETTINGGKARFPPCGSPPERCWSVRSGSTGRSSPPRPAPS
jgi:hypothetical protein